MKKFFKEKFNAKASKRRKSLRPHISRQLESPVLTIANIGGIGSLLLLEPNFFLLATAFSVYGLSKDTYANKKQLEWQNKKGQTMTSSLALKNYLDQAENDLIGLDIIKSEKLVDPKEIEDPKIRLKAVNAHRRAIRAEVIYERIITQAKEMAKEVTMKNPTEKYEFLVDQAKPEIKKERKKIDSFGI